MDKIKGWKSWIGKVKTLSMKVIYDYELSDLKKFAESRPLINSRISNYLIVDIWENE